MTIKRLCIGIDLDGTICTDRYESGGVLNCKPLLGAREKIHEMREAGHKIIIFTHRHNGLRVDTLKWLQDNDILYDKIIFDKPYFDVLIDDRARQFVSWERVSI